MRRILFPGIPVFVAAAVFVLSSPALRAQQEHDHSAPAASGHACACCGNSGSGAMDHAAGGGCCGNMAMKDGAAKPDSTPMAQGAAGGCCGGMAKGNMAGMAGDSSMNADMQVFHFLLDNRADIRRTVKMLPDGIETVTESDKPEIAAKLKTHVSAMYARLKDNRPIHQKDPLFEELFAHADQIDASISYTEKGVRVLETSTDPAVAKLLHKHAEVVNGFIDNGMPEMMKDHPVE